MAKNTMKRLSDFTPREQILPQLHKLDEILRQEMILLKYEFRSGDFGDYVVMELQNPETGEIASFSCGGQAIVKQLETISKDMLPLAVTPVKYGRVLYFE